jgi:hypothetical protein
MWDDNTFPELFQMMGLSLLVFTLCQCQKQHSMHPRPSRGEVRPRLTARQGATDDRHLMHPARQDVGQFVFLLLQARKYLLGSEQIAYQRPFAMLAAKKSARQ